MPASRLEMDEIKISVPASGTLQEQSSGEFWGNGATSAADVGAETQAKALEQVRIFFAGHLQFQRQREGAEDVVSKFSREQTQTKAVYL